MNINTPLWIKHKVSEKQGHIVCYQELLCMYLEKNIYAYVCVRACVCVCVCIYIDIDIDI